MAPCQYVFTSFWMGEWSSLAVWDRHFTKHKRSEGGWRDGKKVKQTFNRCCILNQIKTAPFDRQAERRTTEVTVVLPSLLVIVRIPFSARIQHCKIDGFRTLRKNTVENNERYANLYTPRAYIVLYSTDLKNMRMLPVWRRKKKDKFSMNFFHDLLEIPDWEKDIVLLSYVHIYIYTCCSQ